MGLSKLSQRCLIDFLFKKYDSAEHLQFKKGYLR